MTTPRIPVAIVATEVAPRTRPSNYPALFAARMAGRIKHPLVRFFRTREFWCQPDRTKPRRTVGAQACAFHAGRIYLCFTGGRDPGDRRRGNFIGCRDLREVGLGDAHLLVNRSDKDFVYLEVGDRSAGDSVFYPDDDLKALRVDGRWQFTRKDGTPY